MSGDLKKPSYSKEMRDRAKADGRHLITVDVPGMLFQGPCTKEQVTEAIQMVTRWFKDNSHRRKAKASK